MDQGFDPSDVDRADVRALERELARLQAENAQLRRELDTLKAATAHGAPHAGRVHGHHRR